MTDTTSNGFTITVPTDCPDPAAFREIVAKAVREHFNSDELAAMARHTWRQCQIVPEPFASNLNAAGYYRSALIALHPAASRWIAFEEAVNREFAAFEDDGDAKAPAIPGWVPSHWISFD